VYKLLQLFQDQQADTAAVLDALPFGLATAVTDGSLTSANPRFLEMFGLRPESLPESLTELLGSEAVAEAFDELRRNPAGARHLVIPHPKSVSQHLKVTITPCGGRSHELLVSLEPADGPAVAVRVFTPPVETATIPEPPPVAVPTDVPHPAIEVRFAAIPALIVDANARVIAAEGVESVGLDPQVVDSSLTHLVEDGERLRLLERVASYFQSGALMPERIQLRMADRSFAEFDLIPQMTVTNGEPTELRLQLQRVPERPAPQPDAPRPDVRAAVRRLAAGVGQEFSGQLQVIYRHADILLNRYSLVEGLREELELIRRAAQSASDLAQRLLYAGSRDDSRTENYSINTLMAQAEAMIRALAGMGISCTFRLAPGLGPVKVNPAALERVLVNLVIFARDSMPDGGTIAIDGAHLMADDHPLPERADLLASERVGVAVSFPGAPLEVEDLANIFEPFHVTATGRNFGLHLIEARGIVEQAGGELLVVAVPDGMQFVILLPKVAVPVPVTTPVSPIPERNLSPKVPELSGPRVVLLVDDDQDVRRVIRSFLERGGFDVVDASDGREAISAALRYPGTIDILLTDVQMQHRDGYELARTITETRPDTKILFMTGYQDEQDVDNPALAGRFLQKPFTEKMLIAKLKSILGEAPAPAPAPAAPKMTVPVE
jgi:CheY-like chemotaxis protein